MKIRTIQEIETIFHEMGLTEKTWGQEQIPESEVEIGESTSEQIFIRIETTTTPLEDKTHADLA